MYWTLVCAGWHLIYKAAAKYLCDIFYIWVERLNTNDFDDILQKENQTCIVL